MIRRRHNRPHLYIHLLVCTLLQLGTLDEQHLCFKLDEQHLCFKLDEQHLCFKLDEQHLCFKYQQVAIDEYEI